jgi:hypothetical protein
MNVENERNHGMKFELLQPWATFVMKTQLPPPILEKMIKITDEVVEKKEPAMHAGDTLAGQIDDEFFIYSDILEREGVTTFFLDMTEKFIVKSFCQKHPFHIENVLTEKFEINVTGMWVVSQKDNEYNPIHRHLNCQISSVMYLKIPEFLPSRKQDGSRESERRRFGGERVEKDGAIEFSNNYSHDDIWSVPELSIEPQVGDFFIFPASQRHQVYPFRTVDGKGERRSVSFNAEFSRIGQ